MTQFRSKKDGSHYPIAGGSPSYPKEKTLNKDIKEKHHQRLDEMLDDSRKQMHKMLDDAHNKEDELTEHQKSDNYVLPKQVITVWGKQGHYDHSSDDNWKKEQNKLRHLL